MWHQKDIQLLQGKLEKLEEKLKKSKEKERKSKSELKEVTDVLSKARLHITKKDDPGYVNLPERTKALLQQNISHL